MIRGYRPDDAETTMAVFRRAVTDTASRDYNSEQVHAWAGHTGTLRQWNERRMAVHTWVAEVAEYPFGDPLRESSGSESVLAGFIDVDDAGYIDVLFVDPSCSRRGMASLLLGQVERFAGAAGLDRLTVHASITARPFFAKHGFRVIGTRHPAIGAVTFTNYLMSKP